MNCLVILDKYWPVPEANGLCINSIADHLGLDYISVLCRVNDKKAEGVYTISDNKDVTAVYFPADRKFSKLSYIGKIVYVVKHIIGSLFGALPNQKYTERYSAAAESILQQRNYKLLISVLNPLEAVEAGKRMKETNKDICFIIYDLDSASNCSIGKIESILKKIYIRKVLKWEMNVFNHADLIVHLANHKKHFSQSKYRKFIDKTIFQEVPLLNLESSRAINNEKVEKYSLIYAGAFYHRLREPDILLDIIYEAIKLEKSIKLDIYTKDNYQEILSKKCNSDNICVHDFVDQEKLDTITASCNALISLGNKVTEMFPSKIISYINSLKSVIHIYQNLSDPVITFLKGYPNALLLDGMIDPHINAVKLIDFLRKEHDLISIGTIKSTFEKNTGQYCAQEISVFLKDMMV